MIKVDMMIMVNGEMVTMSKQLRPAQAIELLEFYMLNQIDSEFEEQDTRVDDAMDNLPRSQLSKLLWKDLNKEE